MRRAFGKASGAQNVLRCERRVFEVRVRTIDESTLPGNQEISRKDESKQMRKRKGEKEKKMGEKEKLRSRSLRPNTFTEK